MAVTCGKQVTAIIWNQIVRPIRHYSPDIRGRTTDPAAGNSSHFLYHIVGSTADALRASPRCVSWLLTLRLRYVFHATSPTSGGAPLRLGSLIASEPGRTCRNAPWVAARSVVCSRWFGYSVIKVQKKGNEGFFVPLYMNIALGR